MLVRIVKVGRIISAFIVDEIICDHVSSRDDAIASFKSPIVYSFISDSERLAIWWPVEKI